MHDHSRFDRSTAIGCGNEIEAVGLACTGDLDIVAAYHDRHTGGEGTVVLACRRVGQSTDYRAYGSLAVGHDYCFFQLISQCLTGCVGHKERMLGRIERVGRLVENAFDLRQVLAHAVYHTHPAGPGRSTSPRRPW